MVHRGCFHPVRNVDIPGQSCSGVLILRCQYSLSSRWPTSRWTLLRPAWTILLHNEKRLNDYTVALPVCTPPDTHGKSSEDAIPGTFSGIITTVPTFVYTFQSLAPYHPPEVISLHAQSSRCASKGLSVTRRSTSLGRIHLYLSTRLSPVLPAESSRAKQRQVGPTYGLPTTHLYRFQITKSSCNLFIQVHVLQSFLQLATISPNLPT